MNEDDENEYEDDEDEYEDDEDEYEDDEDDDVKEVQQCYFLVTCRSG